MQLRKFAGRVVRIRIGEPSRSNAANRYYWGCVIGPIAAAFRQSGVDVTDEDLHEICKRKFLPPRECILPGGEAVGISGSTATLSRDEFSEYVEQVLSWTPAIEALAHYGDRPETYAEYLSRTGERDPKDASE